MRDMVYYNGIDFDVEYYVEKGEPETYDHPGSADKVHIQEVWIDTAEVKEFLNGKTLDYLETYLYDRL